MLGSKLLLHMKPTLLLHSCCGPCSTAVIEKLLDDYTISVFYFNPCIYPQEEYIHRRDEQKRFLEELSAKVGYTIDFIDGDYQPETYYDLVKGLEGEPEGGARCKVCFKQRLGAAANLAKEKGYEYFDTTLTVSPHKNYNIISEIGKALEEEIGIKYLAGNYKKQDGYKRSIELSREYNLYRQNYCGCEFSKRD